MQLDELQKAFEADSIEVCMEAAERSFLGWDKLCVGNPESCGYTILGPIVSVARQVQAWAGQLYSASIAHTIMTEQGELCRVSLTYISQAGSPANIRLHDIKGECPFDAKQLELLMTRIRRELVEIRHFAQRKQIEMPKKQKTPRKKLADSLNDAWIRYDSRLKAEGKKKPLKKEFFKVVHQEISQELLDMLRAAWVNGKKEDPPKSEWEVFWGLLEYARQPSNRSKL